MTKAVIFDCFGVLITDALEAMLAQLRSTDPKKAARIVDAVEATNKGLMTLEAQRQQTAEIFGISVAEYLARLSEREVRNQPLFDYIQALRKEYKVGLLSNVSVSGLQSRFKSGELDAFFDVTVVSGEIGFAKPEARAYEIMAEKLGVRLDECVMIDDREPYCAGARAVGMQAVQYQSVEQLKQDLTPILKA